MGVCVCVNEEALGKGANFRKRMTALAGDPAAQINRLVSDILEDVSKEKT